MSGGVGAREARQPERVPLVGRYVRLDLVDPGDVVAWRDLREAIGHPAVFAGGYGGGQAGLPDTEAAFVRRMRGYLPWDRGNSYLIRAVGGIHDGEVVGTSSLADFDLPRESAHLGWTAYSPRVWGTQVNPEAKLLLLGAAFDAGFGRVKLQADARNTRSREAIARLGATFEGIARRDRRRADGSWRDAAIFSVIVDDWPTVRADLEARLASWGDRPVLFRTPPSE